MARKGRETAGGLFHITCHSVWSSDLFRDDVDRMDLLAELATTIADWNWTCLSYCLMTSHLHLIVEVGEGTLAAAMQRLNTRYARRFNARHGLRGHVFGSRYGSNPIRDEEHLLAAVRYVARNPVEAGLCTSPGDWPWSSYAGTVGLAEPSSFVDADRILRSLGGSRTAAIAELRKYVETG